MQARSLRPHRRLLDLRDRRRRALPARALTAVMRVSTAVSAAGLLVRCGAVRSVLLTAGCRTGGGKACVDRCQGCSSDCIDCVQSGGGSSCLIKCQPGGGPPGEYGAGEKPDLCVSVLGEVTVCVLLWQTLTQIACRSAAAPWTWASASAG